MSETETIEVAAVSEGPGGTGRADERVRLPVVEVLTGRGFITGKSGSGKSNTASVVVEKLLAQSFPVLIVDIDGEYYGLKEKYEILHAGADEECDIQVGPEHAEKLATLALEQNVPIILDVSSFLDEDEAKELLTAVARQLFAREKKLKRPFLLIVEEIHEFLPEGGGMDECGRMLVKIGKRGRKHGLGLCGISQRPADVKKDFITQCDWIVWHRLTWNNDTTVVRRVLDGEYAEAVEDLADGEGFLMTDWTGTVRRVQFFRKRTFDAGATPGLEDFERPELKSVSDDLVSELHDISEAEQRREDRIAELREELDRKNSRIAELEAEVAEARDLSRMADQFAQAMVDQAGGANPGRTEQERMRATHRAGEPDATTSGGTSNGATNAATSNGSTAASTGGTDASTDSSDDADEGMFPLGAMAGAADVANGDGAGDAAPSTATASGQSGSVTGSSASTGSRTDSTGSHSEPAAGSGFGLDGDGPPFLRRLAAELTAMDAVTRQMLRVYRDRGPETPVDAYEAAGGTGDRPTAYAHNRELRLAGFVEHDERGRYAYTLPAEVSDRAGDAGIYRGVSGLVGSVESVLDEAAASAD